MQKIMMVRAKALLSVKAVARVAGWKKGALGYDITPAVFGRETRTRSATQALCSGGREAFGGRREFLRSRGELCRAWA